MCHLALSHPNGERNKAHLVFQSRHFIVGGPILIQSRHNPVAVFGYHLVEPFLRCAHPVGTEPLGLIIRADGVAKIEVAVAERSLLGVDLNPIVIHAKGTHHHLAIVTSQIAIERSQTLSLQFEENRIDELHHIIATECRQCLHQPPQKRGIAPKPKLALQVDVAGIILPVVTITRHHTLMSQSTKTFSQGGMHIRIIAQKKNSHHFPVILTAKVAFFHFINRNSQFIICHPAYLWSKKCQICPIMDDELGYMKNFSYLCNIILTFIMEITVIVPVKDRRDHIGKTLDSILRGGIAPKEVIIVDNESTDGTYQFCEQRDLSRSRRCTQQRPEVVQDRMGLFLRQR